MIKFKDLQNRVYSGKDCIRFEYGILVNDQYIYAQFQKQTGEFAQPNEWNMRIIFGRTRDKDSEVYNFGYIMPKDGLPLELIAATGLRYFQLHLKQEVQTKINIDFTLGDVLAGM